MENDYICKVSVIEAGSFYGQYHKRFFYPITGEIIHIESLYLYNTNYKLDNGEDLSICFEIILN